MQPSACRKNNPSGRVLCDAVAEGPVLLLRLDEVDEDVLGAHARRLAQTRRDAREQRFANLDAPARTERDLDEDDAVGPRDAEVAGVVDQSRLVVLGEDLEAILLGNSDGLDHRAVDRLRERAAELRRRALAQGDADEWHDTVMPGATSGCAGGRTCGGSEGGSRTSRATCPCPCP